MRLIDADALHKSIVDRYWMLHRMYEEAQDEQTLKNTVAKLVCLVEHAMLVKEAPTIDTAPVVHARWETYTYSNRVDTYGNPDTCAECSNCGGKWSYEQEAKRLFRYCPYCGAKMDEKEDGK